MGVLYMQWAYPGECLDVVLVAALSRVDVFPAHSQYAAAAAEKHTATTAVFAPLSLASRSPAEVAPIAVAATSAVPGSAARVAVAYAPAVVATSRHAAGTATHSSAVVVAAMLAARDAVYSQ